MAVIENTSTEIGDIFLINASFPIMGLTSILGFTEDTVGEQANRFFKKEFRFSLDGVVYSNYFDLTVGALTAIITDPKKPFYIDYRYTRQGLNPNGVLEFNFVQINGNYTTIIPGNSFNNSIFSQFLTPYDTDVLAWSRSVLEKAHVKSGNTVPKNIDRDGDFIDFWRAVTTYFAFIVIYARSFRDFDFDDTLIREYLSQRDLFVRKDENYVNLLNILNGYYNEIRKRGTIEIIKTQADGNVVDGELLRLIEVEECDEFLFSLTKQNEIGWWIDSASPNYRGIIPQKYINKSYEDSVAVEDINLYPILGTVVVVDDGGTDVLAIDGSLNGTLNGIGANYKNLNVEDVDFNKVIIVSPNVDYRLSFEVKQIDVQDNLTFGVLCFDINNNIHITFSIVDGSNKNVFFERQGLNKNNFYYTIEGFLFNINEPLRPSEGGVPTIGTGQYLKFSTDQICKVLPFILVDNEISFPGNTTAHVFDFKMTPLATDYGTGFIQNQNLIRIWMKNNSKFSDIELEDNIRKKLIPYNSYLGVNLIN